VIKRIFKGDLLVNATNIPVTCEGSLHVPSIYQLYVPIAVNVLIKVFSSFLHWCHITTSMFETRCFHRFLQSVMYFQASRLLFPVL